VDSAKIQLAQIDAIQARAAQVCARQPRSVQVRAAEVRFAQIGVAQVGRKQVRFVETDFAQIESVEIARPQVDQRPVTASDGHVTEVDLGEGAAGELAFAKRGQKEVRHTEFARHQRRANECGTAQMCAAKVALVEDATGNGRLGQTRVAEPAPLESAAA